MSIQYAPTGQQRGLLDEWLPGYDLVADHSWGLVPRAVWELAHETGRFIAKIGAESDHHIRREIHAHRHFLTPWSSAGVAPSLVHADDELNLLLTRHLPGDLIEGTAHARDPEVFEQAGRLLALLHAQPGTTDRDHEKRENRKSLAWLDKVHRIAAEDEAWLRREIAQWPTPPTLLVPTHGDWQPRNWLLDEGVVRVIDFGRTQLQPAMTDLVRMAGDNFVENPELETAFITGYGTDPREPDAWRRIRIRNAIGTAVWAHQVGDADFEAHGLSLIKKLRP